jgi:hypothetical protein
MVPPAPDEPPRRHLPSSTVTSFIDPAATEQLLAPWLPEPADRAFVARCILREGPAHHRGANDVLLRLLGELLARRGAAPSAGATAGPTVPVPIRLPPAVAGRHDDAAYPLRFPRRVLERLAPPGSVELAAMIDCVTDGPPQHALANAAMLCVLDALLEDAG